MIEESKGSRPWVYRLTVPSEKSDELIRMLSTLDLTGEDALEVLRKGDG